MNQLLPFIINHWVLWLALVAVIILLIYVEKGGNVRGVQKIAPQAAVNFINHESAKILDVREVNSFKAGHLTESINIPLSELEQNLNKLNKYKTKPIIIVCSTGQAALKAGILLNKQGFEKVYALTGGIAGWQRAGLPLTKD